MFLCLSCFPAETSSPPAHAVPALLFFLLCICWPLLGMAPTRAACSPSASENQGICYQRGPSSITAVCRADIPPFEAEGSLLPLGHTVPPLLMSGVLWVFSFPCSLFAAVLWFSFPRHLWKLQLSKSILALSRHHFSSLFSNLPSKPDKKAREQAENMLRLSELKSPWCPWDHALPEVRCVRWGFFSRFHHGIFSSVLQRSSFTALTRCLFWGTAMFSSSCPKTIRENNLMQKHPRGTALPLQEGLGWKVHRHCQVKLKESLHQPRHPLHGLQKTTPPW